MDYIRIFNKKGLMGFVVNELKNMGVKYRKEKKSKVVQETSCNARLFRMPLHSLDLTDVILTNGVVVQIPIFVADSCSRILEEVETEGIFRKAGSSIRQKEIRVMLESGMPLGKSHHVIDLANVIKYFFRELPDPLIPNAMHETLLRSLLIGEDQVEAILLTCLLLPPLTINTLRFFMQFLYTVSLSEVANKMSSENLAIIFTPGLMPFANINSHRFANHLKVVQLLIQNANSIGIVPSNIANKLEKISDMNLFEDGTPLLVPTATLNCTDVASKKKKKRRSGSLTNMFNGFKKMVGSAIGSSEDLDDVSRENKVPILKVLSCNTPHNKKNADNLVTPCHKSNKKRKIDDPACAFSSKKRKDLLALLPSNSGGLLPSTPITRDNKKIRLSVNGSRNIGNINLNPIVTSMERRWSIVGSGWSKNKNKQATEKRQMHICSDECIFNTECFDKQLNYKIDKAILSTAFHINENYMDECSTVRKCDVGADKINNPNTERKDRIIKDVKTINTALSIPSFHSGDVLKEVQTQYEQMLEGTASLSLATNVELHQHIRRDLKTRRSDQQDIRSPSARKIGSIRRRSQDKHRVKHFYNTSMSGGKQIREITQCDVKQRHDKETHSTFYTKGQIKRNRQDINSASTNEHVNKQGSNVQNHSDSDVSTEKWLSAEEFFKTLSSSITEGRTEVSITKHVDYAKTPTIRKRLRDITKKTTCAHETLSRKTVVNRTPSVSVIKPAIILTPIVDDTCVRDSISRLRTQNAGMVMAKAKLFDGMGNCAINYSTVNIQQIEPYTNYRDQQIEITNTAKLTTKGTTSTKQQQGGSCTQRRQYLANGRHANKILVRTMYNKEGLTKQRNIKDRTSMGIIDGKIHTNLFCHSDFNSNRTIKRRQQREFLCNKLNQIDFSLQN